MATFKAWWGCAKRKRRRALREAREADATELNLNKENRMRMEIVTDKIVTGGIVYVTRNDPFPDPAGLYILQKEVVVGWWAWNLWSGEFVCNLHNPCPAKSLGFQIRLERSGDDYGTGWRWIATRKGKEQIFRAQTEAIRLIGL